MNSVPLDKVKEYEVVYASIQNHPIVANTIEELQRKIVKRKSSHDGWSLLGGITTFERGQAFYAAQTMVKIEDEKQVL